MTTKKTHTHLAPVRGFIEDLERGGTVRTVIEIGVVLAELFVQLRGCGVRLRDEDEDEDEDEDADETEAGYWGHI